MSDPTITVHGMFGKPKQYTREQYVNEWASHFSQMYNITVTREDRTTIKNIATTLRDMAGRRWDEIFEKEGAA